MFIWSDDIIKILQAKWVYAGWPVIVNSGTWCATRNAGLPGSVNNSGHLTGEAADIYVDGWTKEELGTIVKKAYGDRKIQELRYCYLIAGSTRAVHVGVDRRDRKNVFAF
jgi:hypothetical protein